MPFGSSAFGGSEFGGSEAGGGVVLLPGRLGASPWDMLLGRQQGRIEPAEVAADGFALCLGLDGDAAEHLLELVVGDYIEFEQTGDFDTETYIAVPVQLRGPATLAVGTTGWKVSLRINGAERVSRTFGVGASIDTVLTANVSALSGDNSVAIRLELV